MTKIQELGGHVLLFIATFLLSSTIIIGINIIRFQPTPKPVDFVVSPKKTNYYYFVDDLKVVSINK